MDSDWKEDWLRARAVWPDVEVSEGDFARYLDARKASARQDAGHVGAAGVTPLRTSDLYLACACSRGDPTAIRLFEAAFFGEIDRALRRRGGPAVPPADDVKQMVRDKLFVGAEGAPPKIADYAGRGDLRGWLRVTVTRMVINLGLRGGAEVAFDDAALVRLLGTAEDPELQYVRRVYQAHFRAAFDQAFRAMEPRQRSLLRAAFGQGLTVDAIGKLYDVHRATAARWVVAAHEALRSGVRASFMQRSGVGEEELSSVLRLIESRLELSLESYLRDPPSRP